MELNLTIVKRAAQACQVGRVLDTPDLVCWTPLIYTISSAYNKDKASKVVTLESQASSVMNTGNLSMFYPYQTVFNDNTNNTHRPLCAINGKIPPLFHPFSTSPPLPIYSRYVLPFISPYLDILTEVITIHIPVRNPLQIPVTLSNLSLHCLHSVREPNDPVRTSRL